MRIPLNELSHEPKEWAFTSQDSWLAASCLAAYEDDVQSPIHRNVEHPRSNKNPSDLTVRTAQKPGTQDRFGVEIQFVDDVAFVHGSVSAELRHFCSRCGLPFTQRYEFQFRSLYSRDSEATGEGSSGSIHHRFSSQDHDAETDLEITHLHEDFIDLSAILTEQLLLQVPFQPIPEDGCKGVCLNCGTNWNLGKCGCDRLGKAESPFAMLAKAHAKVSNPRASEPNQAPAKGSASDQS